MQMKNYQLLYTFSVEYFSVLTCKPQIIKLCGVFCRIDNANVSNLILIIRSTALCNNFIWNICVYGSAVPPVPAFALHEQCGYIWPPILGGYHFLGN